MGGISQWEQLNVELTAALGSSVHFDTAHQAVYASEASNYRQIPIGVVTPKNTEELSKVSRFVIAIMLRYSCVVLAPP